MLKVLSINSRRYRLYEKIQRVFEFIKDHGPDVVLIQEALVVGFKTVIKDEYQVFVNVSSQARDRVGVVVLVVGVGVAAVATATVIIIIIIIIIVIIIVLHRS